MPLNEAVFGAAFNEDLIHQVVTAYQAGGRAGTKAQKSRSEVSGGGAKPWRQKGTGRARAGTIRSPIWRKGGTTFAAKPRDFSQKVNKKMYKAAIRSILSELNRTERLKVVSDFTCESHKTKDCVAKMKELGVSNALIIKDALDENTYYALRNIPNVDIIDVTSMNPVALLRHDHVVVTEAAIKQIEELLG